MPLPRNRLSTRLSRPSSAPPSSTNIWSKRKRGFQQWLFNLTLLVMAILVGGFVLSALTTRSGMLITIDREDAAQRARLLAMSAELERSPESEDRTVLEILNGVGIPGLAGEFGDYLREAGFDVLRFTNAQRYDYPQTLVINRGSDLERAQLVAQALGLDPADVENIPDTEALIDVTVVLGRDYGTLSAYRLMQSDRR